MSTSHYTLILQRSPSLIESIMPEGDDLHFLLNVMMMLLQESKSLTFAPAVK